jgi:UDP-glucose 4-epimerase
MTNILVTGGAGFVGSCLIRELVKDPTNTVTSLDNYFTGTPDNHVEGVCYIDGDCQDIDKHITFSPDIIYHFGEYSRVSTSFEDYEIVWDSIISGTRSVLEFCRKNKCRIIYSGSSTKFGDGGKNKNASPYAFHKAQNTETIINFSEWFGIDYAICYFYNVYGPGQICTGKYATVIGIFETQVKQGEAVTVVLPGTQKRSFTHINDIVSGLLLLKDQGSGDGYCIGNPTSYEIDEVAKMFTNNIVYLTQRPGERLESSIDLTHMHALGWTPTHDLENYVKSLGEKNDEAQ